MISGAVNTGRDVTEGRDMTYGPALVLAVILYRGDDRISRCRSAVNNEQHDHQAQDHTENYYRKYRA